MERSLMRSAIEFTGSHAALEATGSYHHVYETLDENLAVTLVNPSKTRAIAEGKTDRVDAKMRKHLLRSNMLLESHVTPNKIHEFHDLVRARKSLMEDKNRAQNRVHAVLTRNDITYHYFWGLTPILA